jgi:hypothetical protein
MKIPVPSARGNDARATAGWEAGATLGAIFRPVKNVACDTQKTSKFGVCVTYRFCVLRAEFSRQILVMFAMKREDKKRFGGEADRS